MNPYSFKLDDILRGVVDLENFPDCSFLTTFINRGSEELLCIFEVSVTNGVVVEIYHASELVGSYNSETTNYLAVTDNGFRKFDTWNELYAYYHELKLFSKLAKM